MALGVWGTINPIPIAWQGARHHENLDPTLTGIALVLGGLVACGHRAGHHGQGWSEGRLTELRGRAIDRISRKLDLNAGQKAGLEALADQMIASRKALRGDTDPRTDMPSPMATDQFDRAGAQQWLDQKRRAVQDKGPQVLGAFADFYDSLKPEQQRQVRERLEQRRHGWWGRG